jgi:hypothetical protein
MLKIKNNTTNFTQDLKNYFVNEPQKTQEIAESKSAHQKWADFKLPNSFTRKTGYTDCYKAIKLK